ncbi:hypothetical protein AYY18_00305 [Morganella psychrotolerans]|uniref:Uncharacterized protein n=1 Tax=Morganella psychrotolerans TaxID=368603 RepID=A0A1B8HU47_9GAMM|nr:hypothetical protein AYY18_00305 [Morganella psychrotolerans]
MVTGKFCVSLLFHGKKHPLPHSLLLLILLSFTPDGLYGKEEDNILVYKTIKLFSDKKIN